MPSEGYYCTGAGACFMMSNSDRAMKIEKNRDGKEDVCDFR